MTPGHGTLRALGTVDVSTVDYHDDNIADQPTLSASIAKYLINQSPAHAYANHPRLNPIHVRQEEDKFDLGTVAHALLLEGRDSVEVCDFDAWRSKDAKQARDDARAAGKIPMLAKHWDECQAMVAAVRAKLASLDVQPAVFTAGKAEQTLVWEDHGVLCRARLDWLRDDLVAVDDLKSTRASAEGRAWERTLYGMGADVQVAFYLRGVKAVYAVDADFRFVVVETQPPFELSVVGLAASALAVANDKVDHALRIWAECLKSGVWPGYDRSIHRVEVPQWEEARWLEKTWAEAA